MRHVMFLDGSIYNISYCGASSSGFLRIVIDNYTGTILDAANAFSKREKVKEIKHYFDGTDNDTVVYQNYTLLSAVSLYNNELEITLQKEGE